MLACKKSIISLFRSFLWLEHKLKTAPSQWPLTSLGLNTTASLVTLRGGWWVPTVCGTSVYPTGGDWLCSCDASWGQVDMGNWGFRITQAHRANRTIRPCCWPLAGVYQCCIGQRPGPFPGHKGPFSLGWRQHVCAHLEFCESRSHAVRVRVFVQIRQTFEKCFMASCWVRVT